MRHHLLAAAVVATCILATGCGSDEEGSTAGEDGTASTPTGQADTDAFCAEMTRLSGERPEEYVGSPEHVEDIEALQAAAPAELRSDVETYREFLESGAVDPADPDSNLTEDWPPAVQTAIGQIQAFEDQHC